MYSCNIKYLKCIQNLTVTRAKHVWVYNIGNNILPEN